MEEKVRRRRGKRPSQAGDKARGPYWAPRCTVTLGATGEWLRGLGSENFSGRMEAALRRGDRVLRMSLPVLSAGAWAVLVRALWRLRDRAGVEDLSAPEVLRVWSEWNEDWPRRAYGVDVPALAGVLDSVGESGVMAVVEMVERYEPLVERFASHGERLAFLGVVDATEATAWDRAMDSRAAVQSAWDRAMADKARSERRRVRR